MEYPHVSKRTDAVKDNNLWQKYNSFGDFWGAEEEVIKDLRRRFIDCIEKDLKELLNFYSYPNEIWIKVRTTKVIERAFREVRRRIRPMSCFNNSQSIERIVYAILSHLNDKWRIKPLYEFTQKS